MTTCHNCGLPQYATDQPGIQITVSAPAENKFRRETRRLVWCHSDECAIQALAVSRYGSASHKWPITLAQFRATKPLDALKNPSRIPLERARMPQERRSSVS